jgi:hypothetical protein
VALAVVQPAFGQVRIANEFRKRGLTASLPACFLEAFVIALILVVAIRFAVQIVAAAPPVAAMLSGFLPSSGRACSGGQHHRSHTRVVRLKTHTISTLMPPLC